MKRFYFAALVLLAVLALVIGGCSKTSSTPVQTSSTPTQTAPAQVIKLTASCFESPTNAISVMMAEWIKMVEEETQGRVEIELFTAETMGKSTEQWELVKTGVVDMTWIVSAIYPGVFPLTDFATLPLVVPPDHDLTLLNTIFNKYLTEEWSPVKVLWAEWMQDVHLHTSKKQVKTLEDLKGMQIRCAPGAQVDSFKALGAIPAMVPLPEVYSALDKGMIDGASLAWQAISAQKISEVTKFHTEVYLAVGVGVFAMNNETWNSLPPDIQQIFTELIPAGQELGNDILTTQVGESIELVKSLNHPIVELTPEERARWDNLLQPVVENWLNGMEGKGYPEARDMLNDIRAYSK